MTDSRQFLDPHQFAPSSDNPTVADVMRREVVFCLPSTPLDMIAKLMFDNSIDEIPVLIDQQIVGYVTADDIVPRVARGDVLVAGSDLIRPAVTTITARDIMHTPALVLDEHSRLSDAITLMRHHERTTAVITHEDTVVVGMVTPLEVAMHIGEQTKEGSVA